MQVYRFGCGHQVSQLDVRDPIDAARVRNYANMLDAMTQFVPSDLSDLGSEKA